MAICPHCHQTDKNFFAPVCHNCNHSVGFLEQLFASLFTSALQLILFFGFFYMLAQCSSG